MEIFQQSKDVSQVSLEIDGLQKFLTVLVNEKAVLTEDLEGYETEGYEYFKTHVLAKEKVRLALLRMTIPECEEVKHARLQGQFNEVELLERNKERIETSIAINKRKTSDSLVKIEKLKKRLTAQTKGNN